MKAILKAPVDLLYNGGIGTYVKASRQTHADVGDRANDAIRVNGARAALQGGGRGRQPRLHAARPRGVRAWPGGRIYTDAIDNSAGVDCSDHEVNIKILLGLVAADGELTEKQRNKLLAEMTDEVGRLVLADNYFQTQSLSVSGVRGDKLLDAQASLIRALEKAGRLNRAVEFLPSDDEIAERRAARAGLTAAGARGAPRVLEDGALRRPREGHAHRRRVRRARARRATSRRSSAKRYAARHAAPPAQARDHRHRRRQLDDQPHRVACSCTACRRRPAPRPTR